MGRTHGAWTNATERPKFCLCQMHTKEDTNLFVTFAVEGNVESMRLKSNGVNSSINDSLHKIDSIFCRSSLNHRF